MNRWNSTRSATALLVACLAIIGLSAGYQALNKGFGSHEVTRIGTHASLPASTSVTFTVPDSGGRTDTTTVPARSLGLVGKTVTSVQRMFPSWTIQDSSGSRLMLQPRAHALPLTLGITSGYVAIFYGPPASGVVAQMTGIRSTQLLPADQARLQHGIGVASLSAAWQALEGLGS